jgi:hypothetical protein
MSQGLAFGTRRAGVGCGALLSAFAVLLGACRRAPPPPLVSQGETDARTPDEPVGPVVQTAAPRCAPGDRALALADAGGRDLDLGDAVRFEGAIAVGMVRTAASGRVASLALVHVEDGSSATRTLDLGPALGDAPPPRLEVCGAHLVSAYHGALRAGEDGRPLVLQTMTAGEAAHVLTVEEQRDDSLASDFACRSDRGIVVWDEATREPRGVVRGLSYAIGQKAGVPFDVSPRASDAESPRVVPFREGYAVAWIARGPESSVSAPEASDFEVTGEPRGRGWLEMLELDPSGAVIAPVRALTSTAGHVSAFDVRQLPGGLPSGLLFVARDDGETVDGSGGTLLRVRVTADGAEPPLAYVADGLGRGAPSLVDGWLAWVAGSEQMRLLPLDASGAPLGAPGAEDRLDDARPVLALDPGHLLVETPGDPVAQLRTFACSR